MNSWRLMYVISIYSGISDAGAADKDAIAGTVYQSQDQRW